MESSNVMINDELCSEPHSENTFSVQEKTMEVEDSIPDDYVGKHSDKELQLLNNIYIYFFVLSSSEPSTPVREIQQEQSKPSSSSEQNSTSTPHLWSKVYLLE